jgi:hypothetical protein
MGKLEMLNSVTKTVERSVKPAARLRDFEGVAVGLYGNMKAGGDHALDQEAVYRTARLPFGTLMLTKEPKAMAAAHPELGWLADHPDLALPAVEDPACFGIAVVGGTACQGTCFYDAGEPVTIPAEE